MSDLPVREEQVERLLTADVRFLVRLHESRRNRLARMEEWAMPQIIIDNERRMVAEARLALQRKGIL